MINTQSYQTKADAGQNSANLQREYRNYISAHARLRDRGAVWTPAISFEQFSESVRYARAGVTTETPDGI